MKKLIEFQTSKNHTSALLTPRKPNAYDDLVLVDAYRKYSHRFAPGKTKIRLLPAISTDSNWLMEIPVLQHMNGRHCHPRVIKAGAESVYDLAYKHMKEKCPNLLFNRANKSGIRLLPMPVSICWAIVEDANGIKVRLLLNSFYDGKHGGASGLGDTIYKQVLRAGEKCDLPGHPLNHLDGTSILVERIGGSDTKFPSYRVSLADDRSPLQPLLEKITEVEHNVLCPVQETIRILSPEEEWRLLSEVIGDDLVAEVRAAHAPEVAGEEAVSSPEILQAPHAEESPSVDEAIYHPDDFKDFPTKWEI